MRVVLTVALFLSAGSAWAQYPYAVPPAYGYMTKYEAMQQQAFENKLRLRQQEAWERANPEQNETLSFAEQALRVRVLKAQERYYRDLEERQEEQRPKPWNPFYNPFIK
jgi:hypothetical protein